MYGVSRSIVLITNTFFRISMIIIMSMVKMLPGRSLV